jgi:hypothetical protein
MLKGEIRKKISIKKRTQKPSESIAKTYNPGHEIIITS